MVPGTGVRGPVVEHTVDNFSSFIRVGETFRFANRMGKLPRLLALLGIWVLMAGMGEAVEGLNVEITTYIVQVSSSSRSGSMNTLEDASTTYASMIQAVSQGSTVISYEMSQERLKYVFGGHALSGFTALLTSQEADALMQRDDVMAVYRDQQYFPQTTRTPGFIGLSTSSGLWPESNYGSDTIVGVLDKGVWPESESFNDVGFGPIPARWRGTCQTGKSFTREVCNKKLIGARYFSAGYEAVAGPIADNSTEVRSPRDTEGHGTHTASTAAGSPVNGASLNGLAAGIAQGIAPKARVAVYKICWSQGCFASDILAGFEAAVADGVDVISLSVGGEVEKYEVDLIAIGAFGAAKSGIFVSCSAGNSGPGPGTVQNNAPWVMTVGASTVDREFPADVELGDGKIISGTSLYSDNSAAEVMKSLVFGGDAALKNKTEGAKCTDNSLDPEKVKDKIVLCQRGINGRVAKGDVVRSAGGAGMILANSGVDGEGLIADSHLLPAVMVGAAGGSTTLAYITSTPAPTAKLSFSGTKLGVTPAPAMASFSSRGPNPLNSNVLKPDITAPGVNILAAWTGAAGPSPLASDTRRVKFNIISGTSMSCPHISGLGALLKSKYQDWSPSAIKSAIMTSASLIDNTRGKITDQVTGISATPFDFGSGHATANALDPGLVYDMATKDYVNFLCAIGYSVDIIVRFTANAVTCPNPRVEIEDMNYPSFSAVFKPRMLLQGNSKSFTRKVTNVGFPKSTYTAKTTSPDGYTITVDPGTLTFSEINEIKSFTLTVTSNNPLNIVRAGTKFGSLEWSDGKHFVRSPIAITMQS